MKIKTTILTLIIISTQLGWAQTIKLEKHSVNSGGEFSSSTNFKVNSSVGISTVGLPKSTSFFVVGGFQQFLTSSTPSTAAEMLTFSFAEQVGPATINSGDSKIDIQVLTGTNLNGLVAIFTFSFGATVRIGTTTQESGVTSNDFSSQVVYEITAEDGTTMKNWTVTVTESDAPSTETDFLSYDFPTLSTGAATINTSNQTIGIEVINSTDLTFLVAEFALSTGATVNVGVDEQVSGITANDFTSDVTYMVTAEDNSTQQSWTVSVSQAATQSSNTEVTDLTFTGLQTSNLDINPANFTITITVPFGTDVTAIEPNFSLPPGARVEQNGNPITAPIDFTNSQTFTVIAEDGTMQDWTITIIFEVDNKVPTISYQTAPPETFTKDGANITINVTASDNNAIQKVEFHHKKLRSETYTIIPAMDEGGDIWSAEITGQMLDELGVEFFFTAFDPSDNEASTSVNQIFLVYSAENSLSIPSGNLGVGGKSEDWRMFSIPYELKNNSMSALFSEFGDQKDTEWRLVHYLNDVTRFVDYPTRIDRGKGYWINSKKPFSVKLGETVTPGSATVQLQLQKGWNQIGNPYPFTINWNSVKNANSTTATIEGLRVFNGGKVLTDTNSLASFGAAYVNTSEAVTLNVPFDASVSTRMKGVKKLRNPIDNENWEVIFNIKSGVFENDISGIGMRQDASISRDTYDYMRVPRFIRFVDMSFSHPEDYNLYFSRDVVPTSEYYEWDLNIETNVEKGPVEISWDNSYFGIGDKKLLLFDLAEQKIIDLSQQSNYKFPGEKRSFKIFYGSLEVLEGKIRPTTVYLGKSYPNPFTSSAIIPFTLPENVDNFNVRLEIFDILGSKIYVLTDRAFEAGFHYIEWHGTGSRGASVDSGFYIIVMKVTSEHTGTILSQKILKR